MSREMQIEEMARIICKPTSNKGNCEKCGFEKQCSKFDDATRLYNAGYRKQNDEELIDKIATYFEEEENWERLMRGTWNVCGNSVQLRDMLRDAICGAKMKGGLE